MSSPMGTENPPTENAMDAIEAQDLNKDSMDDVVEKKENMLGWPASNLPLLYTPNAPILDRGFMNRASNRKAF